MVPLLGQQFCRLLVDPLLLDADLVALLHKLAQSDLVGRLHHDQVVQPLVQGVHPLVQRFQLGRIGTFLPVAGIEHPAGFQHCLPPVAPHGLEDFQGHQLQLPFREGFQLTDARGQTVFFQIQGGLLFVAVALKPIDLGAVRLGVPQIPPQLGTAVAHQLGDPDVLGYSAAVLAGLAVLVQQVPLTAFADVVAPMPEFLVDDGGEVSLFQDVGFLVVVLLPAVLQQVGGLSTVVDAVAHVGGVAQDAGDLAGIPFQAPAAVLAVFCNQGFGHLSQTVAGGILFKDHPHRLGLFLIDDVGLVDLMLGRLSLPQEKVSSRRHPDIASRSYFVTDNLPAVAMAIRVHLK